MRVLQLNHSLICKCCIVEHWMSGSNSGRRQSLILFEADTHYSTWSRFSWSDIGYYHMDGCSSQKHSSCLIFRFSDFSDEMGPYASFQTSLLNWFSPWVRNCFFFQSDISYVALFCCRVWNSVIQIRKLKYFTHLSMYVIYYVLCAITLLWQTIHSYFFGTIYEPIFYILYFYADMVAYYTYCAL